jgi:predicted MFS family arabinose efflux permease
LVSAGLLVNHSADLPLIVAIVGAAGAAFGLFVLAGATPAALGLLADISERFPADRGAIMGLYSVFLAIGQITGALIGGVAADLRGIDGMLLATAGLLVVALIPLARLREQEHQLDAGGTGGGPSGNGGGSVSTGAAA